MFMIAKLMNILSLILIVISIASLIVVVIRDKKYGTLENIQSKQYRILQKVIEISSISSIVIVMLGILLYTIEFKYN